MGDFVTPVAGVVEPISTWLVTDQGPVSVLRRVVVAATLESWLPFLIYGSLALAIPASMIVMSFVFAQWPSHRVKARRIPFESGDSEEAPGQQRRFTVSFYLTAMLFILFDIEIVFLYPLAVQLELLGWFGFVELLVFVAILAVAYVYVWRKGALEWH